MCTIISKVLILFSFCQHFRYNIARYSKKDILKKNKLLFCVIPESLIELEQKILSVDNDSFSNVIDCIETLRWVKSYSYQLTFLNLFNSMY